MEPRRLLSSFATASLILAGAGCGAPVDPTPGARSAAVFTPVAARIDGTAVATAGIAPITRTAVNPGQGTLRYIDVGAPTGTTSPPVGDPPAPSGSTPDSAPDPDPGAAEPGSPPAGQLPVPSQGPLPDPACAEQALDLTPACYRDGDLITQAGAACPDDQLADRVLLVDSCVGGHQGASVRCCPAISEPLGGKPQVCKARSLRDHDLCLSPTQFLSHARVLCRREGMALAEPRLDAGDCQGGAVSQLDFACCYVN